MSGFKTHLAGGAVSGAAMSGLLIMNHQNSFNAVQIFTVFLLGSLGGIIPDLDSDTGKPLSLLFGLISVVIPVFFMKEIARFHEMTPEFLISYFVVTYFLINFGVCTLIKRITRHRGIMHSIPFAVLCGQAGFLAFIQSGKPMAIAAGIALFLGCMTHLILDEIHSMSWEYGFMPQRTKSSGTALKFKSASPVFTLLVYCLIILAFIPMSGQM